MNSDCARIQDALMKNDSTSLNEEATNHLKHCTDCAAAMAAQKEMKSFLQRAIANDDAAPAALRARIRLELHKPQTFWQNLAAWFEDLNKGWLLAAVAATVLAVLGGVRWQHQQPPTGQSEFAANLNCKSESANSSRILKIGFVHHKECAVAGDYSAKPQTLEQMAHAMGSDWNDLVPLVTKQIPPDFKVTSAHHCEVEGRQFVHLILSNQQTLLSLALTPKNGDSFDAQKAVSQITNATMHQLREQEYSIVGFETKAYFGYVVSGLTTEQNMQIALGLAPLVSEFVLRRES